MSETYSLDLYVPVSELPHLLTAFVRRVVGDGEHSTHLALPDGSSFSLPVSPRSDVGRHDPDQLAAFDVVMRFPVDDVLLADDPPPERRSIEGGVEHVHMGLLSGTIDVWSDWALLRVAAMGTTFARSFRSSPSVHQVAMDMLAEAGPEAVGVLDLECSYQFWLDTGAEVMRPVSGLPAEFRALGADGLPRYYRYLLDRPDRLPPSSTGPLRAASVG